ncbi:MAG: riboflavin synthase [Verrucomicrobiota bacterium]|nr:riboflavin synthase [Verrucomicrobiota bacterium]
MFSGIVEEAGRVVTFQEGPQSWRLTIAANTVLEGIAQGDSIAVNGCCLTAIAFTDTTISFDLLGETVRLTSFKHLRPGAKVNLERSLKFDGKIGGHFVTGHIDIASPVEVFEARGKDHYLRVTPQPELLRYIIHKGSIAIDGISLTVAEVDATGFAVWLIPHTLAVTNLSERVAGDLVNLEFDLLGKYVEKLLPGLRGIERSV